MIREIRSQKDRLDGYKMIRLGGMDKKGVLTFFHKI